MMKKIKITSLGNWIIFNRKTEGDICIKIKFLRRNLRT